MILKTIFERKELTPYLTESRVSEIFEAEKYA